ncbi:hypothetical protein CRG98_010288 [Punica granatum]|uniref:Uncharacterized protein n=1 Tax=Punica granatum TaxID=22663 RepID=A0A2I0KL95_PUNGR|nr:hypothetical protein CRG98_010288 [Punica granatum]
MFSGSAATPSFDPGQGRTGRYDSESIIPLLETSVMIEIPTSSGTGSLGVHPRPQTKEIFGFHSRTRQQQAKSKAKLFIFYSSLEEYDTVDDLELHEENEFDALYDDDDVGDDEDLDEI